YQGCAEIGVCYPPITKQFTLSLPGISAAQAEESSAVMAAPAEASPELIQSETDQITNTMKGGSTLVIVGVFFLLGLGLAFTPCIFPMIPILSGIIAGHGDKITTQKAFVLSLVYVLAMAITYTIAGVLAGLFGENLQAYFQNPWILSSFALVFVLLALSMFGFYDLQLPSSLQSRLTDVSNKQQGGSLAGVAIMGFLSALIVGPCVAPPLAGALIYIGQTGDALLGGLALFALSMGMGAPLIAIGTSAGKLLPRAGSWMDAVKAVFGVALLGVAIVMLERIIPAEVAMLLWGILLIISAVYMGALRNLQIEASGWQKLWKGLGVVFLVYGTLMLVGAAAGGKDTLQPLRGLAVGGGSGGAHQELVFKRIKSLQDLQQEVASASAAGKSVMLDFYADWCVSCKEMEKYTFTDADVIAALSNTVLLQADVTANDDIDQALLQGHFGLPGPPAIIFYGADGQERKAYRVVGFKPADAFAEHAQQAIK
ncbi:MAG: protein-disulfide reductase DsbD, partial [Candidatus Thiodiazotropha taylori]